MPVHTVYPHCNQTGSIRPDIVCLGEQPYGMSEIEDHLSRYDLYVMIDALAGVYPAAIFWQLAPAGCLTVEINIDKTAVTQDLGMINNGPATQMVPQFIQQLLLLAKNEPLRGDQNI